ncbi:ankyrin repeat domain-containing protein [Streptomyces dubilierae]|uniref:Ankyrin repeat domain-containing protein n=1 Tax=Streptomyces dubilierae TaxID=3075533 RepID=A0ABU2P2P0_9ACTN|nr:ankyrin repeat domain-containing protein [Streptomyces sp. DSM 41921]MDT0386406.1 ankyrin repeat domain-containing protein [Streptomyces sp. DSM 41921]
MRTLTSRDPLAVAVTGAIRAGDLPALRRLLAEHPGLAGARIAERGEDGAGTRTLLHIATDWPGHLPRGPEVVAVLVAAGADPNARFGGAHEETPLHWAASNDDVPVLDALLAAGADIEAPGAVIAGGTPLADARAFGQWRAALRLVEHGARTTLQDAATLGLLDRVRAYVEGDEPPSPADVTSAFWGACHGGHLPTAQYLLAHGADPHWRGYDGLTPLDVARGQGAEDVVRWLRGLEAADGAEGSAPGRPPTHRQ